MGRSARGVNGIELTGNDAVVGVVAASDDADLLTVTENGYGKRTPMDEYRTQSRYGKGLKDIKTSDRNGHVTAIAWPAWTFSPETTDPPATFRSAKRCPCVQRWRVSGCGATPAGEGRGGARGFAARYEALATLTPRGRGLPRCCAVSCGGGTHQ